MIRPLVVCALLSAALPLFAADPDVFVHAFEADNIEPGRTFFIGGVVGNSSDVDAGTVTLRIALPQQFTFVAKEDQNSWTCTPAGSTVECTLDAPARFNSSFSFRF